MRDGVLAGLLRRRDIIKWLQLESELSIDCMSQSEKSVDLPVKRIKGETLRDRLTENAYKFILPARYLGRNEKGEVVETPEEMFHRVAENISQPEAEYGNDAEEIAAEFYEMMTGLEFMPNSPTLMNAGTELQQLAACFVISPEDNLDSIFDTVRRAAVILQSGGGVGYSFSKLRPKGDVVQSTGGIASGPVSFMHVYDQMCATLKQGGRRRGAQMGILRVDHPDIGRFIVAKRKEGVLANFNISVAVTDEFIEDVKNDAEYILHNPRTGEPFKVVEQIAHFYNVGYEDANPDVVEENFWRDYADEIEGVEEFRDQLELEIGENMALPARFVWNTLVDGAWRNGEPGLFMIDEANRDHSFDIDKYPQHRIEATNPCGEEPLENFEACSLGHINLSLMVAEDAPDWRDFCANHGGLVKETVSKFLKDAVDWEHLRRIIHQGTRFLDNAVTMSAFPLPEIDERQKSLRSIGLGIWDTLKCWSRWGWFMEARRRSKSRES